MGNKMLTIAFTRTRWCENAGWSCSTRIRRPMDRAPKKTMDSCFVSIRQSFLKRTLCGDSLRNRWLNECIRLPTLWAASSRFVVHFNGCHLFSNDPLSLCRTFVCFVSECASRNLIASFRKRLQHVLALSRLEWNDDVAGKFAGCFSCSQQICQFKCASMRSRCFVGDRNFGTNYHYQEWQWSRFGKPVRHPAKPLAKSTLKIIVISFVWMNMTTAMAAPETWGINSVSRYLNFVYASWRFAEKNERTKSARCDGKRWQCDQM